MTLPLYGTTNFYLNSSRFLTRRSRVHGGYTTYITSFRPGILKRSMPFKMNLQTQIICSSNSYKSATLYTQFPRFIPQPTPNAIIAIVNSTDPQKLISTFYSMLITPSSTKLAYDNKSRWEGEVGVLEDEEWSETLDSCKAVSPKLSDRLSQIYILHRACLTPLRVARFKRGHPNSCLMCLGELGTIFHLIWACPSIQGLWKQIVDFIHDTMGSPFTLDPKPCLLGIFPDSEMSSVCHSSVWHTDMPGIYYVCWYTLIFFSFLFFFLSSLPFPPCNGSIASILYKIILSVQIV